MDIVMKALNFAANKHKFQKRKDPEQTPYVNHVIGVANILCNEGGINDPEILAAALLHDTVEDTDTTMEELEQVFGSRITCIVNELTDDKSLQKHERKQLQIQNAKSLSHDAILVRLADKIYNLRDLNRVTPAGWSEERVQEYFQWSSKIAKQIMGVNDKLDAIVKDLLSKRKCDI